MVGETYKIYKFILERTTPEVNTNKLYDENSKNMTQEEIGQIVIKKYIPIAKKALASDKHISSVCLEIKCRGLSELFEFE